MLSHGVVQLQQQLVTISMATGVTVVQAVQWRQQPQQQQQLLCRPAVHLASSPSSTKVLSTTPVPMLEVSLPPGVALPLMPMVNTLWVTGPIVQLDVLLRLPSDNYVYLFMTLFNQFQ